MVQTCVPCGRQFPNNVSLDRHRPKCPQRWQIILPEARMLVQQSQKQVHIKSSDVGDEEPSHINLPDDPTPPYSLCTQVASSVSLNTSKTMCLMATCHWLMYHPTHSLLPNLKIAMPRQWCSVKRKSQPIVKKIGLQSRKVSKKSDKVKMKSKFLHRSRKVKFLVNQKSTLTQGKCQKKKALTGTCMCLHMPLCQHDRVREKSVESQWESSKESSQLSTKNT